MKREAILSALSLLGQYAQEEGIKLEVSIYGGAAFMLAYNSRDSTKDVDAILRPREEGEKLVARVARDMGLIEDWLNSCVGQFLSPKLEAKRRLTEIEKETGLIVHVPTAKYLLAMKAFAARRPMGKYKGDYEDLGFLVKKMKIQTVEEIQEALDAFYPDDVISDEDYIMMEQMIKKQNEQ